MHINKKIPAMTLNELLVVMIISTIVIGMAFSVLQMVQKHMWSLKQHMLSNTTLVNLEQSLWIDFNRHNDIRFNKAESTLIMNSERDSITYKFEEKYIVKERDTFMLSIKNTQSFFNGNAVNSGTLDAIKITLNKTHQEKSIFIYNRNSANQFMN